jgi:hypothetical protein
MPWKMASPSTPNNHRDLGPVRANTTTTTCTPTTSLPSLPGNSLPHKIDLAGSTVIVLACATKFIKTYMSAFFSKEEHFWSWMDGLNALKLIFYAFLILWNVGDVLEAAGGEVGTVAAMVRRKYQEGRDM